MAFRKNLFVNEGLMPLKFKLFDCKEKKSIAMLLELGGGLMMPDDFEDDDDLTIVLAGTDFVLPPPVLAGTDFVLPPNSGNTEYDAILGADYIVACCKADSLIMHDPDFLFKEGYTYKETYLSDLEMLLKQSGLCRRASKLLAMGRPKGGAAQAIDPQRLAQRGKLTEEPASSSSSDEEFRSSQPPPSVAAPSNTVSGYYTNTERRAIVAYIVEHNLYACTSAQHMWQVMERKNVCPGRTWPSLREHFLRRIKPCITQFQLDDQQLAKFGYRRPGSGDVGWMRAGTRSASVPSRCSKAAADSTTVTSHSVATISVPNQAVATISVPNQSEEGTVDSSVGGPSEDCRPTPVTVLVISCTPSLDDQSCDLVGVRCSECSTIVPYSRAVFRDNQHQLACCANCPPVDDEPAVSRVDMIFCIEMKVEGFFEGVGSEQFFEVILLGRTIQNLLGCSEADFLNSLVLRAACHRKLAAWLTPSDGQRVKMSGTLGMFYKPDQSVVLFIEDVSFPDTAA